MDRKDFIKNIGLLGIGAPFMASLLSSCKSDSPFFNPSEVSFSGKVLIIGAGAAGLTAGYILNRNNIDFQIIEASSVFGGRVKKIDGFADFPIDLGAEWIHTDPEVFEELVNDSEVEVDVETIVYRPQTISHWKNEKIKKKNWGKSFYSEYKFKNTTWYDFLETYIVPEIKDNIVYDSPVNLIDYQSDKVVTQTIDNQLFEGDIVLVTVPTTILQEGFIEFQPALPDNKKEALEDMYMPEGIKVFIEFSEAFYPDLLFEGGVGEFLRSEDEKIFYNAGFRKDAEKNILGLFTIGERASIYTNKDTEQEIIDHILDELDTMFEGKASETYVQHVIQNWSKEPFVKGSYTHFHSAESESVAAMLEPINNKIYFAGEALSYDAGATVHGAATTAYEVLGRILVEE